MAGNEFEDGQGSFWSLRDKREQQIWLLPSLFPRDFGGITWNGEFLGGNEGAAARLGWQSRVCGRLARKGAFPRSRLANPTGGAEVGCQRARRWLQLSPYLQQGGCHAQPRPRHRSSGTAPGSGQAKISPSLVGGKKKTTSGLQDSQTGVTRAGEAAAAVARTRLGCSGTVPGQGLDWQRGLPRDEFDLHGAEKCQAEPGGKEGRGETSPLWVSGDGWVLPGA